MGAVRAHSSIQTASTGQGPACLKPRSCSTLWPHCYPRRTVFVLHYGICPDEAGAVSLKGFQSCCLELELFEGVLIRRRLIFGYSTFWLGPQTRRWDDAVGPCPSPPLRWGFSQLSLCHLLLCVHQAITLSPPLWLTDLDLALVLSKCWGRNLAVTCCWDMNPAAGVTCAEAGGAWQSWGG